MAKVVKRVAVTGGAGQISYSLLFRIAAGELLGRDQPVVLHILELPEAMGALEGVEMELEDCAFPLLEEIKIGSDPEEVFGGVDYAFLVGAKPRGPGMERKDLLGENGTIFVGQGKALDAVASKEAMILVLGIPCNTNCLIALRQAKRLNPRHFFAMTCLDEHRAKAQIAKKAKILVKDVSHMTIWGNHSATQVPDFVHAKIGSRNVVEVIKERKWLETDFITAVQKRGAAVIAARGKSSAASAAHAAMETMRSVIFPTKGDDWFSVGLYANPNPYGIEKDLVFSFPCRTKKEGVVEIVPDLAWDDFLKNKIAITEKELVEERDLVRNL